MAIRIRTVSGKRVALCAAKSEALPGDVYLNDADHHALTEKFENDFNSMGFLKNWNHRAESKEGAG